MGNNALRRALKSMTAVWAQVLVGAAVALQHDNKELSAIDGLECLQLTPLL